MNEALLRVTDLAVEYARGGRRPPLRAVDGVSFELAAGETLGLVGESGSGKSTVAKALLQLTPVHRGRITFDGRDITQLAGKDRRSLSSAVQVVFQDPYSSFNPSRTIGDSLREMLRPHGIKDRGVADERAVGLIERVGLDASALDRYPGTFSGGQRQRIAIARALMVGPKLLICDEAVSALDLSVQAQVINLLRELQQERGISLLFISHDLTVVSHVAQRVMVLHKGQVMEAGDTGTVYSRPQHPYTQRLLDAVPVPDPVLQRRRRAHPKPVDEGGIRVVTQQRTIAGPGGDVPARLYLGAAQPPAAALVWVHGGAFVSGDLDMPEADWVGRALAARGISVLSLDYRKAKEANYYPAASDDVLAGWSWAVEHVDSFGVPVERLHLGGASAGGNLVAGVTKRLRDGAGPLPASLVLAYPVVHAELPTDGPVDVNGIEDLAGDHYFSPALTRRMTVNYVGGDERLLADPYAFPSNGDAGGQPPVFVMNCEYDSLRASGHAYAIQLAKAGVVVREETLAQMQHGALNRPGDTGRRALDRIASWIVDGPAGATKA